MFHKNILMQKFLSLDSIFLLHVFIVSPKIVSTQAVKEDIRQPQVLSPEELAKAQEAVDCKSGGMKLFKGVTFKAQGARCLADTCLKEPFGTRYVKICSLEAAKVEFAKLEPNIQATFYVGTVGQIQGRGVIVVNSSNPRDFYYTFTTSKISLSSIMAAFGDANVKLPPALSKIVLAEGANATFSSRKRRITGTTLLSGHGIQGKARVYDFNSKIKIRIDLGKMYMLSINMPVVSLDGGKVKLYHSFKKDGGPTLECFVQMKPQFEVDMVYRAFASVLGIEDVVRMQLNGDRYEFFISGKILGKLRGMFRVYSILGELRDLQFRINGTLGEATRETLQSKVEDAMKRASNEARNKVKSAKDEITPVAKEIMQLQDLLENATMEANFGAKSFIEAQQEVEKYEEKAKTTCDTTCDKGQEQERGRAMNVCVCIYIPMYMLYITLMYRYDKFFYIYVMYVLQVDVLFPFR